MVILNPTWNLTCPGQTAYQEHWHHVKASFPRSHATEDTNRSYLFADTFDLQSVSHHLSSIKNSLVGSRTRKIMTMNDPSILSTIPVLAHILEIPEQDSSFIKLKIEAAAIVGLLCLPEDQTVLGLLRARLPRAIINALTKLLRNTSIETMLFHATPTTQIQHHLLRTLLRTLSSLYSIVQDVSTPTKWAYMTKSPERAHQPQTRSTALPLCAPIPSSSPVCELDRFNLKGKSKAPQDSIDDLFAEPLTPQDLDVGEADGLTQHFWLTSKRNELKESCEYAKVLLLKYLASETVLIPLILAVSPSVKHPARDSSSVSLCSIADLAVPCFQLIWLICKDTRRQVWLVRQLIEAGDTTTPQDSRLKALIECLKGWLRSSHDQAVEYSIRALGSLLSINEPPHSPQDHDLLEYLDLLIWGKTDLDANDTATDLDSWGIGWILLTCRAKDGNPTLRAALATSSVCLVRNFPDIRLRILKLQIHNTIALMDNSSHSIAVRAEAAYALAHAVTASETLQLQATEAGVIPVLKNLLDKASEPSFPYPTTTSLAQNAMLRESAYMALASLMATLDQPRQEVIELGLLPSIVKSLKDESILVKASACQCCRALSRAISVLRTKLADEGAGARLFDLAFGEEGSIAEKEEDEEDEEAVGIQMRIGAMSALCNLVLDFSPMKQEVLNRNGIDKFAKLLRVTKHQSLRVSALWGLKNMTFSTSLELKMKVVATLGWDEIYILLEDKNPAIQENMISLLRNVVCGDVADIEIVFRHLAGENQLMNMLEDRLMMHANTMTSSRNESIIIQTIYTLSNIVTGSETHKRFIMGRTRTMDSVFELMSHRNAEIRLGAIWCVINLTYCDESTDLKLVTEAIDLLDSRGVIAKLGESVKDAKSEVRERAECALSQIRKRRKA